MSCSAILLEVPHFASLHDATREVCVLRSDNGVTWSEHQLAATDDAVSAVMANNFDSKQYSLSSHAFIMAVFWDLITGGELSSKE